MAPGTGVGDAHRAASLLYLGSECKVIVDAYRRLTPVLRGEETSACFFPQDYRVETSRPHVEVGTCSSVVKVPVPRPPFGRLVSIPVRGKRRAEEEKPHPRRLAHCLKGVPSGSSSTSWLYVIRSYA